MTTPSRRDLEQLSAYLDGQLSQSDRARLEIRIKSDAGLAAALEELRQTRAFLRRTPQRHAPRNFTLTPGMAGIRPPVPRLVQHVVRINGYDSPEVHPPASDPRRDEIRAAGQAAREAVARALGFDIAKGAMRGPPVIAALGQFDKYGRLLAELYAGGVHVNAAMIAAGFGVAYGGGSKAVAWAAAGTTVGGALPIGQPSATPDAKKPRAPRAPRKPKAVTGSADVKAL